RRLFPHASGDAGSERLEARQRVRRRNLEIPNQIFEGEPTPHLSLWSSRRTPPEFVESDPAASLPTNQREPKNTAARRISSSRRRQAESTHTRFFRRKDTPPQYFRFQFRWPPLLAGRLCACR